MDADRKPASLAAPLWLLVVLVASGLAYFVWRDCEDRRPPTDQERRQQQAQDALQRLRDYRAAEDARKLLGR